MTAVATIAQELYDSLEDRGFVCTSNNDARNESEWTKHNSKSGNFSAIEVFVNLTNVEVYRGEFSKDEVQLGAKDRIELTTHITDTVLNLIGRKVG